MFGLKRALIRIQIAAERRKIRGSVAVRDQIVKKKKCGTTGRVEEHFLRHVQGSRWRGSRRKGYLEGRRRQKNPKKCSFRAQMTQAQMEGG